MSDKLKAAQEKRTSAAKKIQQLREKFTANGDKWLDSEEKNWRDANAEHSAAAEEITQLRAVADVHRTADEVRDADERENHEPNKRTGRRPNHRDPATRNGDRPNAPTEEIRAIALQGWMRARQGLQVRKKHREAMQRTGMTNPRRVDLRIAGTADFRRMQAKNRSLGSTLSPEERQDVLSRALSGSIAASGGATVPDGFVSQLEVAMLAYGNMLQVAEVLRTETGNDLPWPTANDTSNEGEIIGENMTLATEANPSFAAMILRAYKFSSKLVKVPHELLEDSAFDLATWLALALGERLGRAQNRKYTVGAGGTQPTGAVTAATQGKETASASALTVEELKALFHSVDPNYRNGASWMMHDTTAMAIRLLKGSDGHYYWWDDISREGASNIDGRPVFINNHMAEIAASAKVVLFGNFKKYKIRQVARTRIKHLVERYAENDQEGFVSLLRADGNLLDAGTHPLKYLQMHA